MSARPDFALNERRAELDAGMRNLGLHKLNGLEQDSVRWGRLLDRLCAYLALLHKWNQVHNLTAIREPAQMVTLHLLDSLALLPWLQQIAITPTRRVLDVGTGGGLPGIPLAIAGPSLMGTSFLSVGLLDSNQKKAAFLQQAVTELELNQSDTEVRVFAERIELHRPVAPYDLILCRAFSSLTEFVQPTRSLLASLNVETVTEQGYLQSPYRSLRYLTPQAGIYAYGPERYPGTRTSTAAATRLKAYLPWRATAEGQYRFFTDTWGIRAHTAGLEYVQPAFGRWTFSGRYRYYTQGAATFYSDLFARADAQNFMGRDKEYSPFDSHAIGLGASYALDLDALRWLGKSSVTLQVDHTRARYHDFRDLRGRPPGSTTLPGTEPLYGLDATVLQLYLSAWF